MMIHKMTIEEAHDFRIKDKERDRILGLIDELKETTALDVPLHELKKRI